VAADDDDLGGARHQPLDGVLRIGLVGVGGDVVAAGGADGLVDEALATGDGERFGPHHHGGARARPLRRGGGDGGEAAAQRGDEGGGAGGAIDGGADLDDVGVEVVEAVGAADDDAHAEAAELRREVARVGGGGEE